MKMKLISNVAIMVIALSLFAGCERYGDPQISPTVDDDSDRPAWAQGNTELNDHINRNDESGTTRGGDYGDLFVLLRDLNGVPEMIQIGSEYYVQPIDINGVALELDAEGELIDPLAAIPVDFGRLNVVRSPESVLDQAFEEAMKVLTATGAKISLDFCGRLISTYPDPLTGEIIAKTIDSPLENMAIYKYIMTNMFESTSNFTNRLGFLGEAPYNFDPLMIAAGCYAGGADKTETITIDKVVYINGFIDCIGLNPILNEYEYDFNNDYSYYFNYGDCYGDGTYTFRYNRQETFQNRYIQFLLWENIYYPVDAEGNSDGPVFSLLEVMEGMADGTSRFTYRWENQYETHVKGFTWAIDDAVQVLEFVHGDSNVRFLPDYIPL